MPWDGRAGRGALWLEGDPAVGTQSLAKACYRNYPAHRSSIAAPSGSPVGAEHPAPGSPSLPHLCAAHGPRLRPGSGQGALKAPGVWFQLLFPPTGTTRPDAMSCLCRALRADAFTLPCCMKADWVTCSPLPRQRPSLSLSFPVPQALSSFQGAAVPQEGLISPPQRFPSRLSAGFWGIGCPRLAVPLS